MIFATPLVHQNDERVEYAKAEVCIVGTSRGDLRRRGLRYCFSDPYVQVTVEVHPKLQEFLFMQEIL